MVMGQFYKIKKEAVNDMYMTSKLHFLTRKNSEKMKKAAFSLNLYYSFNVLRSKQFFRLFLNRECHLNFDKIWFNF